MIDTNQLAQAIADATTVKAQLQTNWPAISAAAVLVARELGNLNHWLAGIAEFVIAHGGIVMIGKKLFWNPPERGSLTRSNSATAEPLHPE